MTTKCRQCGVESEIDSAFSNRHTERGKQVGYCPTCQEKRRPHFQVRSLVVFAIYAFLGLFLFLSIPNTPLGLILGTIVSFVVFFVPFVVFFILFIALHELSHAVVAHLVHFRVFAIWIGNGKTRYKSRIRRTDIEIKIFPFSGTTLVSSPSVPHHRLKLFLIYLAGPALHALMLLLLAILLNAPTVRQLGEPTLTLGWSLFWANAILLIDSLIPYRSTSSIGQVLSDGGHLISVPFLTAAAQQGSFAIYYFLESMDACSQNDLTSAKEWAENGLNLYPHNLSLRYALGTVFLRLGEPVQAREVFSALLQLKDQLNPELKFILLNNIAYEDALIGDPELLPEADAYSAEAYKNAPWLAYIVGTRGTVLVQMGQIDEGIRLLQKAMADHTDAHGKAANACILALAEKRRGNLAQAQHYLDSARTLDPHCREIELAAKELASPSTPVPSPLS